MAGQGLGFTPPTFKSQLYDLEQLINSMCFGCLMKWC